MPELPEQPISNFKAWMMAIRPKTLPAAISPVVVGTAMAFHDGTFKVLPALAALMGALLLQIGVNLANDYFDFIKGVDDKDRLGPVRVTQSGLIPPGQVKAGMGCVFGLAVLIGVYLINLGGWPIMAIGAASIISALAYSGGPYPLGSHGLGDLFVFVFFGLVAVCGTYYVQALRLTLPAVLSAIPVGLLITAILVVNNLRDIDSDRRAGKRTLAVILGKRGARIEFIGLVIAAYAFSLFFAITGLFPRFVLLTLLSIPMAVSIIATIMNQEGPVLNLALAGTAKFTLAFSLLFAIGLMLP
ncbi:MAG: 1,4-dihydroxy-2-naphthoate polyprenyltransferase [Deltaproteobacteria bacterium]|nr:1,4-dihydroxy-2-naphthoate polyprenyltransferase [Deltaproteobacteria bacterium]